MPSRTDEMVLDDLLIRWEELRERGEVVSADDLCRDRPGLAAELRRRIEALEKMSPVVRSGETTIDGGPSGPWPSPAIGTRMSAACRSNYGEFRFHARGGLGEVFRARGDDFDREVAIKLIQDRTARDPSNVRRFVREAEITGRLEHPGVVPVYGRGHDAEGRPCYAMRFVDGETLESAIAAAHGRAETARPPGGRPWTLRDLLTRFVSICNTVGYAHARGWLHRDIKPANVMLGPFGEAIVVDWGLARPFQGQGEPAGSGESGGPIPSDQGLDTDGVVGTPGYMSPEQAGGVDAVLGPPADVYSLGATLYVILCGRSPFRGVEGGVREVLDRVRKGIFPRPSAVDPKVPRALEAICLKAMALDAAERYPTATDLAADVDRWLADEPVAVYRDPALVRIARWAKRHRTAVAGVSAVVLTTIVALSIGLYAVDRQRRATDRQRILAETNFGRARRAVDLMLDEVGTKNLVDVPQMEKVRKVLLSRAREFYEEFLGEDDSSTVRFDAGLAYRHLAEILQQTGEEAQAVPAFEKSVALLEAANTPSDPGSTEELAVSLNKQALLLSKLGRSTEADGALRRASGLLEGVMAADPGRASTRRAIFNVYHDLGLIASDAGRPQAEVIVHYRKALALVAGSPPSNIDERRQQAVARANIGTSLAKVKSDREAESELVLARDLFAGLIKEFPHASSFQSSEALVLINLAGIQYRTGRPAEAAESLRQGVRSAERLSADFPTMTVHRVRLAQALLNSGDMLIEMGLLREAEAPLAEAAALWDRLLQTSPTALDYREGLSRSLMSLGVTRAQLGKPGPALADLTRSEELSVALIRERPGDPKSFRTLGLARYSMAMLAQAADPKLALSRYQGAIEAQEKTLETSTSEPDRLRSAIEFGRTCINLSIVAIRLGQRDLMERTLRRMTEVVGPLESGPSPNPDALDILAMADTNLGYWQFQEGKWAEARDLQRRSVTRLELANRTSPNNPARLASLRTSYSSLVGSLARLNDHAGIAEAAEAWRRTRPEHPQSCFESALMLGMAATAASKDAASAESYADRAMGRLDEAIAKGFRDAVALRNAPGLAPLRRRPQFQLRLLDARFPADPFAR